MNLANIRSYAHIFDKTRSTEHILFTVSVFNIHFGSAILNATKVGLLTFKAHVENYFVFDEEHQIVIVEVSGS